MLSFFFPFLSFCATYLISCVRGNPELRPVSSDGNFFSSPSVSNH